MPKQDIRDLSFQELEGYLKSRGEAAFRASQIFDWIYKKGVESFAGMKNLPPSLQAALNNDFLFERQDVVRKSAADDETTKFLFNLSDHEKIESVLIPAESRMTACISTQVGCKFGCRFCASGIGGWSRNLSCAEIVSQVLYAKRHSGEKPLDHIVFMGIGEPFDNYDNLIKAIRIINAPQGINLGSRKITISTCGLVPRIKQLALEGMQIELAVSLHGPDNEIRDQIMPVNRKYPVKELIAVCKEYTKATNRQITFEYILIKDLTCTKEAAQSLGRLLKGMLCKINLIPYNPVEEFPHQTPDKSEMDAFKKELAVSGVHATIRTPRGRNVNAACGQLRRSLEKNQ